MICSLVVINHHLSHAVPCQFKTEVVSHKMNEVKFEPHQCSKPFFETSTGATIQVKISKMVKW